MLFENQYQIAYVTSDFDEAVRMLREKFGARGFSGLVGDKVVENRVWTPEGEVDIGMRAAIAQIGNLTLEVVMPVSGATGIFDDMLTPTQAMTLHHIAMRCDDLDDIRERHAKLGHPSVMEGAFKAARFMYIDARETLGHYLEYVSAPPEYWQR